MSEKLQTIINEIESGTRTNLYNIEFTVEELLSKDETGIPFLDYIFKKGLSLDYRMQNIINNSIDIAYIYCENNKSIYNFRLNEQDLFSKINGQTYIEYFIEKRKLNDSMIKEIKNYPEIIDILINNKEEYYLQFLSPEIMKMLTIKTSEGTYQIENYLNNDKAVSKLIPLINETNILIELYTKYNNEAILKKANINVLLSKSEKYNTFLQYLINEKNITPELLESIPENIEFVKFLIENNMFEYLVNSKEDTLLLEIESNKTLLEFLIEKGYGDKLSFSIYQEKTLNILKNANKLDLVSDVYTNLLTKTTKEVLGIEGANETLLEYFLDNGCNPLTNSTYIYDENIIKILYQKKRPDLLLKVASQKLFKNAEDNKTYFEYILESIKENKIKTNLRNLFPYGSDLEFIVNYYLIIAKQGMMEYINELSEDDLLKEYKDKTLLEALLEADSNLTLNGVLTKLIKSNPKIAAILKSKGFVQQNVDVSSEKEKFAADYLELTQDHLGIGPLPQEGEILLNQLKQLFLTDGKSDEGLITALISGYRESLFVNYEININEIKKLIEIKKQNPDKFFYIKEEKGAYFSRGDGAVHCDDIVVEILLHETGHALHYYLAQNRVPENYQEVVLNIRSNPETLRKIDQYSEEYDKIQKQIFALVEKKYKDFFEKHYTEDRKSKIRELLSKSKTEKKEEFKSLGIPDEQLDIILSEMFTEEEYIAHQKRIFMNENVDAIFRSEFGAFMAIGDILDAIYEGSLFSETLSTEEGKKIKGTAGHGLAYYYDTQHGFDEMIANFASISKSKNGKETLELLKSIVGEEFYTMLSEFYYQNIVGIKEEELETGRSR